MTEQNTNPKQSGPKQSGLKQCDRFEAELSAYVDSELDSFDFKKIVGHLDTCPACREYVEELRRFARLHRECFDMDAVVHAFDGREMFKNITSDLLKEKTQRIAELFYQLGKAYLTRAFASHCRVGGGNGSRRIRHDMATRPVAIDRTRMKTSRLFREMKDLSEVSSDSSKPMKRAHSFFRSARNQSSNYLDTGRRFVEESLAIDPDRPEPRIFLGCYYYAGVRNYEKAREQFRKVLMRSDVPEENRAEALTNLGLTFNIEYQYEEALACFREVVKSGTIQRHPRFYRCLLFLAITYAKLGRFDQAVISFDQTVKEFPGKTKEMRKELGAMRTFQNVMTSEPLFRRDLENKVPVLFAS